MNFISRIFRNATVFVLMAGFIYPGAAYAMGDKPKSKTEAVQAKSKKEKQPPLFPKFKKLGVWLNSEPLGRKYFEDKLTLVYFWDYTSINCIREMDRLKNWHDRYHPYGLQMIWVHAPEFAFAQDPANVTAALRRYDIRFPVFLDNQFKLWEALKVRAWPTKILVGRDGRVAYTHVGEGGYAATETRMRELLMKNNPGVVLPAPLFTEDVDAYNIEECGPMSSETYLGYKRANWWGGKLFNRQWAEPDQPVIYKDRGDRAERGFFAEGPWINHAEHLEHARQTRELVDYVGVIYVGREVYALLQSLPSGKGSPVYVFRDEEPVPDELMGRDLVRDNLGQTYFMMEEPRLYSLVRNDDDSLHEIRLVVTASGVAVNSFSFSNECLSEYEHV